MVEGDLASSWQNARVMKLNATLVNGKFFGHFQSILEHWETLIGPNRISISLPLRDIGYSLLVPDGGLARLQELSLTLIPVCSS